MADEKSEVRRTHPVEGADGCRVRGHEFVPRTTFRRLDEDRPAWTEQSVTQVFCVRCGEVRLLDDGGTMEGGG